MAESKKNYGVDLFGPTRPDYKWQAGTRVPASKPAAFKIDWENEMATCPEGKSRA